MDRYGGHNSHGMIEPRYGGAVVGYSAFSESYASKSEQHVEYGGLVGKPYKDGVAKIHQLLQPVWNSSSHDRPKKTDKSSPRVRPGSAWNNVHVDNPPSKNHPGKYDNYRSDDSDDENEYDRDDVVCDKNGYCYPKPKHGHDYDVGNDHYAPKGYPTQEKPNNYKSKPNGHDYTTPYYETPNPYGNDYTTPPPAQSYYEAPKPNGNGYTTPPPQPYYEPNNKPVMHKPLPSVKTRLDRPKKGTNMESQLEKMRISSPISGGSQRSPFTPSPKSSHTSSPRSPYSSSPGYRDTIDSGEARRRYGGANVSAPVEDYKGVIDSEEAAKRYKGVYFKY